jgi:hypothetical protein
LGTSHLWNKGSDHRGNRDNDDQKNGQFDGTEKTDDGFHVGLCLGDLITTNNIGFVHKFQRICTKDL